MKIEFHLECTATVADSGALSDAEIVEGHLDDVMAELLELAGVEDPSIELDASGEDIRVTFMIVVEAEDTFSAVSTAQAAIRTAVHAAGGNTPGWSEVAEAGWSIHTGGLKADPLVGV